MANTAAKKNTNGAPVPVSGTSHILSANVIATRTQAKR
jgi:hypothetical protein